MCNFRFWYAYTVITLLIFEIMIANYEQAMITCNFPHLYSVKYFFNHYSRKLLEIQLLYRVIIHLKISLLCALFLIVYCLKNWYLNIWDTIIKLFEPNIYISQFIWKLYFVQTGFIETGFIEIKMMYDYRKGDGQVYSNRNLLRSIV